MTDLVNRTEYEEALAGKLSRALTEQEKRLLKILVSTLPGALGTVPPEFWTSSEAALVAAISGVITDTYFESAELLAESTLIGVDWGLINEGAAKWASDYTFDLVKKINQTSQRSTSQIIRGLQDSISGFFREGMTRAQLEEAIQSITANIDGKLMHVFGPARSEAIAITEVTRAASEGSQAVAAQIKEMGIDMIPIWQTRNDELVCSLCGPRHNKPITDGKFPPIHVRDRCWVNYELPKIPRR